MGCAHCRDKFMQYWASLSEGERRKPFWPFWMLFCATRSLVGHENTRRWMVLFPCKTDHL